MCTIHLKKHVINENLRNIELLNLEQCSSQLYKMKPDTEYASYQLRSDLKPTEDD